MSIHFCINKIASVNQATTNYVIFTTGVKDIMFIKHDEIPKEDQGNGVVFQDLCTGENLNVFHWDMKDGSIVSVHSHEQEQFGYVIKGSFLISIGGETTTLKAGDAYVIPPNVPHGFEAAGDTEAIDVFSPIRSRQS